MVGVSGYGARLGCHGGVTSRTADGGGGLGLKHGGAGWVPGCFLSAPKSKQPWVGVEEDGQTAAGEQRPTEEDISWQM